MASLRHQSCTVTIVSREHSKAASAGLAASPSRTHAPDAALHAAGRPMAARRGRKAMCCAACSAAALPKGGTASVGVTRRSAAASTLCTVRQGCSRWRRGCRLLCRIVLRNGAAPGCAAAGTGGVSPGAAHDACAPRAVRWRTAGLATLTGSNRSWPPRCAAGRHRAPCVIGLMARREGPAGALLSVMKHGYYTGPDAASRPQ